MATLAEGIRIVDADSHMTERHDLFTERAPKGFEDKVPHVEKIDGMDTWVIDGHTFGKAGSGGTIDPTARSTRSATPRAGRGASTTCTLRRGTRRSA